MNNLYVIPAHCVWMLIFWPLKLVSPKTYHALEEHFFGRILGLVAFWNYTASYKVYESGQSLDELYSTSDKFLYMPNHQSTADVPLCMTIFSGKSRSAGRVMWIMDKLFKYTNFGLVSWIHDDFFIVAGKQNRERSLADLRAHLSNVFIQKNRRCLVMFPEGGFLRKRKPVSHKYALKNGLPLLEYCTLPRTGALEIIMDTLGGRSDNSSTPGDVKSDHNCNGTRNDGANCNGRGRVASDIVRNDPTQLLTSLTDGCGRITKIVDVTIAYEDGKPLDLVAIITGIRPPCITHVHHRVFDVKDVPSDKEALTQWLYQLYYDKEEMLKTFYETNRFPYDMFDKGAQPPTELQHRPSEFVFYNLFYLVSTWMFWMLFSTAPSCFSG